jgi:hypothetical protein
MKRVTVWLTAFALVFSSTLMAAEKTVTPPPLPLPEWVPPYLQNPAPDGMTICFAARQAEAVRVSWSQEGTPVQAEIKATGTLIPKTPWTIWKVRLAGLKSGTAYGYRLQYRLNGQEKQEPRHVFHTLDVDARTVRMAVFNDLHNNLSTFELLAKQIKPEDYEFSVLLGDCWTDPSAGDSARTVFVCLDAYVRRLNASEKPLIFVRGNHETRGGFASQMACLFDLPNLDAAAKYADQNFQFDLQAGPVWFVAMDCGEDGDNRPEIFQPYRARQLAWLRQRLAAKAEDKSSWRVLISHLPIYNNQLWGNSEPARQMWEPTLSQAGFALALGAHDHGWKLLPKDQPMTITEQIRDQNKKVIDTKTWTMTPPYPVLIGGGPSPKQGTVMLFEATPSALRTRLLNVDGKLLVEVKQQK